ncbi:unnamed protein product [Trichobilharzia regenti]|nr:unnamed protein product [Trichobilharzia regenti]
MTVALLICFTTLLLDSVVDGLLLQLGNSIRPSNPCLHHKCRWQGETCQVDINGEAKCTCSEPCPQVVSPVCGSDGITYDSTCHLERTACQKMREIHVLYSGECSKSHFLVGRIGWLFNLVWNLRKIKCTTFTLQGMPDDH